MDKKRLVAERIKTVQEQETSKAQARTEQLKKEIERTKAVQDAQRQKELVVIGNQREVEVARQVRTCYFPLPTLSLPTFYFLLLTPVTLTSYSLLSYRQIAERETIEQRKLQDLAGTCPLHPTTPL